MDEYPLFAQEKSLFLQEEAWTRHYHASSSSRKILFLPELAPKSRLSPTK
jgi:hypothetical protein